ncbi:4-diphosphocytidyl-2C-methyl-D-erythritolkinase [Isosphaera pallida ATCC 43644]|uniref:4-diphosphocytidyl-2-C-methyl-D-erythritol kinase n=1 Tax=Isosphaera pallida (strain ATCC 43644 / DSM 9630 / IS1B) TaxID=575540 RepID=E8R008_ISOPI|nr:4-(cytidine 5'-diphospho)-2-C-methyl-D-erythritol kinase [Isosphaera pallida]ADV64284.1 4-diphosphocytidyl-2C-methyl-D-erythritolkinase [Isosphaera pallida ATCC 43644]
MFNDHAEAVPSPRSADADAGGAGLGQPQVRRAPAKLNLFLEVTTRRDDGYHAIETLMVTLDWYDLLTARDDPSGLVRLTCDDPGLPTDATNLVVRAAEAIRRDLGVTRGVAFHLSKAIPSESGLGGGSSDAASALLLLRTLWGLEDRLGPVRLAELAAGLGSDVPFFLTGGAAVCRGRGELVEPIACPRYWFVVVRPPFGIATTRVYHGLELPARPTPIGPVQEAFLSGDPEALGGLLFNRLQPRAERLAPGLGRVRHALDELIPHDCVGALMSGSGSACFALARTRDHAYAAAARLLERHPGIGRVQVVSCGPGDDTAT